MFVHKFSKKEHTIRPWLVTGRALFACTHPFGHGVAGATVIKGIAGFGQAHRIHSVNILDISDHLPVKIEFIETREKVDELLAELELRAGSGLIEVQETTAIVPGQDAH